MSVPGFIVGTVTTSSGAAEARLDAPREAPGDAQSSAAPADARSACHDVLEPSLNLVQGALDGLTRPLAETEFVVVDLETTGGSPADAAITEIAAVRTRGVPGDWPGGRGGTERGRPSAQERSPGDPGNPGNPVDCPPGRAGSPRDPWGRPPGQAHPGGSAAARACSREFATLVNPGRAIPPHVAALTGITNALVAAAPKVGDVLPQFIAFTAGSVLVAHNARFDIGFLEAACAEHNLAWPALPTLDTAALARRMLTTDEVNDCSLGTLADFFGATARPSHRALADARATTAVLHGLLDRLARRGVHTLDALRGIGLPPVPERRRMRQLTAAIPQAPGVCVFTAADGQVLHVVRSSDVHARACGYFAAAETRREVREMISRTARIVPLRCTTTLEAEVAEIRLIATHRPRCGEKRQFAADPVPEHAGQPPALAAVRHVVAARPRFAGGWDVAWIGHGMLEATAVLPRGYCPPGERAPGAAVAVPCAVRPASQAVAARYAEIACLMSWLESPGVRLIQVAGTWCSPVPR